jgi:hypothetical protein
VGSHDDNEKDPAGHKLQVDLVNAPTTVEYVPEEQGEQAPVPSTYVPATQAAEQEEDPAIEYVPALQARHVAMLDAPVALE